MKSCGRILGGAVGAAVFLAAVLFFAREKTPEPVAEVPSGPVTAGIQMGGMQMSTDGSVQLTSAQILRFGVTFGSVEQRVLEDRIRTVGIVAVDETRTAQVTLKFGGTIERLHVDFTGQSVRRAQPLLEIYSPELVAAEQELLLAAKLDTTLDRGSVPGVSGKPSDLAQIARRRLKLWDISDAHVDEILRTGEVPRTTTIFAPVSGVVIEKQVLQGQAVEPGQALYTIADLSQVWVEAELREPDAASVGQGSTAVVELSAFPGRPFAGRVEYVYPTVQGQARTLKARIAVPNPDGKLKPGMFATVQLTTPSRTALTVPNAAVVSTGARRVVFVDLGNGRLMPQQVEAGRVAGDLTEILTGLEPGQRVVTSAQYLLDSESNIGEVMRSMMGQTGSGDMGSADMGGKGADMQGMPGMDVPSQEK